MHKELGDRVRNLPTVMDVEKIFHMKEGLGETSYARNSSKQRKALEMVRHITLNTIIDLYLSTTPQSLALADLGCSSGPNTFSVVKDIIQAVEEKCFEIKQTLPELRVFLNDLPTNDFNSIFTALPDFYRSLKRGERNPAVYLAAVAGSFYGRLFPSNSLHFVHSSFSLHWLSQVPPGLVDNFGKPINKGKMCISETSPSSVIEAYWQQFQRDFTLFLKSRSQELIPGGRMVFILLARPSREHGNRNNTFFWDQLAQAFAIMVDSGEIEEDKVDSYNVHFYAPCMEEIRGIVDKQGSFTIDHMETFEIGCEDEAGLKDGRSMAMAVRAIQETLIVHHFGEEIIDRLFQLYAELLKREMAKQDVKVVRLLAVLRRRDV